MTLTERVRNSIPPQPNLRRVSLRTKLVASVLVLVFAALSLISLASTYALHSYLVSRMDDQLRTFASASVAAENLNNRTSNTRVWMVVPPDYLATWKTTEGVGPVYPRDIAAADQPPFLTTLEDIGARANTPYTVRSNNGKYIWRMLVLQLDDGEVLYVAQRMAGIDESIARLVRADILVGVGVLIALAAVGAALVRQSLIPLFRIRRITTGSSPPPSWAGCRGR
nr:hypothetical protein [Actinoplanes subtropicus]